MTMTMVIMTPLDFINKEKAVERFSSASLSLRKLRVRDGPPHFGAPFLYMHTGCLRTQWTRLPDLGKGPGRGNSDGTAKCKKLSWNPKSSSCWLNARGSREHWKRETGLADLKREGGACSPGGEPDRFMDSAGSKEKKKKNKDGGNNVIMS